MSTIDSRPESMWTPRWCWEQALELPRVALGVAKSQLAPKGMRVAYIGWVGHNNLGDEAIFAAIRRELAPANVRHFAGVRKERFLAGLLSSSRLYSFGVLGGGTLILGGYLPSIETLLTGEVQIRCFGTGVEEFDSLLGCSPQFLDRWTRALNQMGTLYVRGPRSKRLLAKIGVEDVVVSGDAAILDALFELPEPPLEKILGVCISLPTIFSEEQNKALFENMLMACQTAQSEGWIIRIFAVARGDMYCSKRFAKRLGLSGTDVRCIYKDAGQFMSEVKHCAAFLGVRLHSVILAHCAYVPAVMLAYAPKCLDHMEAVGMDEYAIVHTDWQQSTILARVRQAYEQRNEIRGLLFQGCSRFRDVLKQLACKLREQIETGAAGSGLSRENFGN